MILLVSTLVFSPASPANASTTYAVPVGGLSFDANDAEQSDPCTTGFGNSFDFAETDEVNGLTADDFLTYTNVATIDGQRIDAKVTLSTIAGMRDEEGVTVLDRIDKCDVDSKTRMMEINFDSETVSPGDANFVITIDFLANGNPATLTNLKMNVEDIDNNQYLEVDNFSNAFLAAGRDSGNVQEYRNGQVIQLGEGLTSTLSTTESARRFHASGSEDGNGRAETDKHVVEVHYASVSTIVLKLGVYEAGGGSFDLNFSGFTFLTDPVAVNSPQEVVTTPEAPVTSPTLATTGVSEPMALGILASTAGVFIALGTFLLARRRKLG